MVDNGFDLDRSVSSGTLVPPCHFVVDGMP